MKRFFLTILTIIIVGSCKTVPEPKFENGIYTNPEFGFSVRLPEGWENATAIPRWVLENIPQPETHDLKFMFTNAEPEIGIITKARILASCSKLELPWQKVLDDRGEFRQQLVQRLAKRKSATGENPHIKNYSFKTYSLSGHSYPFPIYEEKIDAYHLKLINKGFLYKHYDGDVCQLVFYLISPPGELENNINPYESVINSLRIY